MAVRLRFCCLVIPWAAIHRHCAGGIAGVLGPHPLAASLGTEWADEHLYCTSSMSMADTLDDRELWLARGVPPDQLCIVHFRSDLAALGVDWLEFQRGEEFAFVWLKGTEMGHIHGPDDPRPARIPLVETAH